MSEPLCDLVLLVWNRLEETQQCLETLFRHTDVSSRLLIVDNGSETPTREMLERVRPAGSIVEVHVLRNAENEGYPRGMNRGLAASTAPYACLLNNDLLMTPGWLSELVAVAASSPRIGLVNPSSTTLGQRPSPGQTLENYASALATLRGQWIEMATSIGFCMLIKQEVIVKIGVLDPIFGMGSFEDNDYARRARAAGFICVRAKASYVHHHESRSMRMLWRGREDEGRQRFADNAKIYYERWGKPQRCAYVVVPNGHNAWIGEETLKSANRDDIVRVYYPARRTSPPLADHMNIAHRRVSGLFAPRVLWDLLLCKKKFDRVVVNHQGIRWILKQSQWLHRAQIEPR